MLKNIVFDYGGVLVSERDIKLTKKEDVYQRVIKVLNEQKNK